MNRILQAPAFIGAGLCAIGTILLQDVRQHALRSIAAAVITVIEVFLRRHDLLPAYHCMGSHPLFF